MSPARRRLLILATVPVSIAGAVSGLAYAPRPATSETPSSPPIPADNVTAEPPEEPRFTLNPRMGFFAAGDPVNGADPDGRLSTATLNSFTYGAIGGLASLDAQVTTFAAQQGLMPKPLAMAKLTFDYMMVDAAAVGTSGLNRMTEANPDSTAYKIGSFIPALAASPQLVRGGVQYIQKTWSAVAERLPTLADDIASTLDDLFPRTRMGGAATNPGKAGALFPPKPPTSLKPSTPPLGVGDGRLPNSSLQWGKNRLIKELHGRGFIYEGPSQSGGGFVYRNAATGERVRIMPRPTRAPFRDEPPTKFENEWYYRYQSDPNLPEGPHVTLIDS